MSLYYDYNTIVKIPHPSGDYLGYAIIDSSTDKRIVDPDLLDVFCRVGDCSEWEPIDMDSKYMTEDLWSLGGWHNEEDFLVDCSCEGFGQDSGTGWVERQLYNAVPAKYLKRRGV